MSTLTAPVTPVETREHYLNSSYGIKSWLLTTDHKRIAKNKRSPAIRVEKNSVTRHKKKYR